MAAKENRFDVVKLLSERGADVNFRDRHGFTPLMAVASAGNLDATTLLLSKGADLNGRNEDGFSALSFAAKKDQRATMELLLKMGADPTVKEKNSHKSVAADTNNSNVSRPEGRECRMVLRDTFAGCDLQVAELILSMVERNELDRINKLISQGQATKIKIAEKVYIAIGPVFFAKKAILKEVKRVGEEKTWIISSEDLAPCPKQ
jgi:ankyrin repeat protein